MIDATTACVVGEYGKILHTIDYLSLRSPNGGESWKVGQTNDILWNSSGVDNIKDRIYN